jgi:hypothetical protein
MQLAGTASLCKPSGKPSTWFSIEGPVQKGLCLMKLFEICLNAYIIDPSSFLEFSSIICAYFRNLHFCFPGKCIFLKFQSEYVCSFVDLVWSFSSCNRSFDEQCFWKTQIPNLLNEYKVSTASHFCEIVRIGARPGRMRLADTASLLLLQGEIPSVRVIALPGGNPFCTSHYPSCGKNPYS